MGNTRDRSNRSAKRHKLGTQATKERFVELRAEGRSYDEIAGILEVSRQTLQSWSKDMKLALENAKSFRMDAVKAKYQLSQLHRVEVFCQVLDRIKSELAKRDFSSIPTEKLLDMLLKYSNAAKDEDLPLEFLEYESGDDGILDQIITLKRRSIRVIAL